MATTASIGSSELASILLDLRTHRKSVSSAIETLQKKIFAAVSQNQPHQAELDELNALLDEQKRVTANIQSILTPSLTEV
ncbi:hypothetical protein ACLPJK_26755 [Pseudomonas aeruginosa]|uniref:hypothetical protein n=1 Tax=Pseudomonas aeruginosa TaxID=287 RepID=UPI003D26CFB2